MLYLGLTVIGVIIAIGLLFVALKFLIKPAWLLGWLRGTSGLLIVACAIYLFAVALDFHSYRQLAKNQTIATVSFSELGSQAYQLTLVNDEGKELQFEMNGDLWQLDARLLQWSSSLTRLGFLPGYRLDRLSGRYISLEEERQMPRSVYALGESQSFVDVWSLLQSNSKILPILKGSYGSATYLPMRDGALFAVKLTVNGLIAEPLNERASEAVQQWQ